MNLMQTGKQSVQLLTCYLEILEDVFIPSPRFRLFEPGQQFLSFSLVTNWRIVWTKKFGLFSFHANDFDLNTLNSLQSKFRFRGLIPGLVLGCS